MRLRLLVAVLQNERSALIASSHFEGINSRSDVRRSIEHEVRPMEIETSADSSQKINLFGIHPFFIPKGIPLISKLLFYGLMEFSLLCFHFCSVF